jgi:hypothetical protein
MSFWKKLAKNLLGKPRPASPKPQHRTRLRLERLENRDAPAVLTVNTAADNNTRDNFLSLREAMMVIEGQLAVNTLTQAEQAQIQGAVGPNGNTIQFNIGNAAQTISLAAALGALPALDQSPVTVNGAAPAGSPNQTITIDGTNLQQGPGIVLSYTIQGGSIKTTTSGSTIEALTIQNFQGDGITVYSNNNTIGAVGGVGNGQGVTLKANYIGIRISDLNANDGQGSSNTVVGDTITGSRNVNANTGFGVRIEGGAQANVIGATAATDPKTKVITEPANVISGNGFANVVLTDSGTNLNKVIGNFIGLDKDGKTKLQNGTQGVVIVAGASSNTIGGPAPGAMNVISGNPQGGIVVEAYIIGPNPNPPATTNNTIAGNIIGAAKDGSDPNPSVANGTGGIIFDHAATGNYVRQTQIKWNKGVPAISKKDSATGQELAEFIYDPNSIVGNGSGIVNATSAGAPVLTSAVVSADQLHIMVIGTLASTANTTFLLEFFGNSVADPVGHEQGEFFLGNLNVTTDANGNASFYTTLNAVYGVTVSATATNTGPTGDTSQFSNEIAITGPQSPYAAVGGFVWHDLNGNGLQDPGEPGLAGIVVNLFNAQGVLVATTTTDASGHYLFTNVAPGQYYLQFTAPPGETFTSPYQGDYTQDSHADPTTGDTELFTLAAGEVDPYYGAGLLF